MFVEVYKLGEEHNVVTSFHQGAHVIGRGPALQCNDKRVSRNHATIEVTPNNVKITSNHINPCFLKLSNGKTITILAKDSSFQLHDGDTFAFLPDMFWFKVKIVEDAVADSTEEQCSKRHSDDLSEEKPDKRQKVEENETVEKTECNAKAQTEVKSEQEEETIKNRDPIDSNENVEASNTVKIEQEVDSNQNASPTTSDNHVEANNMVNIEQEGDSNKNASSTTTDNNVEADNIVKVEENGCGSTSAINEKQTESKMDDGTNPSTSDTKQKVKREKCWYGAQCYRKNPTHRQDFTHPGDSDFESDPDDARPSCSFGAACYRKNKDHRREYKHPPRQPPSKKKRTRRKVDRLNIGSGDNDADELSDMSEEDPYAEDGDSDDYIGDSDSDDDTDWEDSQNVDEDSENMRNLVKEAKRFTRK